ncbi:hypothetical protein BZA70DRAFT_274881 [Myxozyma melibiosi]|uniref:Gamma-Tubulin ring complex non-core subunit mod21 N-terminal domain-containing protein n=1 Tax=Myxozyma melibiosi TaxID=54550 RepID=A0ABR1FA15_9ASCO
MDHTPAAAARRQIAELVGRLAGISQTSHPRAFKRVRDRAIATAETKYRSPDKDAVRERAYGLVEKYSVVARDDLSDALKERLDLLFTVDSENTISTLAVILDLAQATALQKPLPDAIVNPPPKAADIAPEIAWREILRNEPLEGDHWNTPTYEDDSEEDFSDAEAEQTNASPSPEQSAAVPQHEDESDYESIDFRLR